MTYLSRLTLNDLNPRVRQEMRDCELMHKRVLSAFPHVQGSGRVALGVLYRVDDSDAATTLLVQSAAAPDWSKLPPWYLSPRVRPHAECKSIDAALERIRTGQRLRFRLRANPTKRAGRIDNTKPGKRVDLREEEEQLAWLERKAIASGFVLVRLAARPTGPGNQHVVDVRARDDGRAGGRWALKDRETRLVFGSVLFEGDLIVQDADLLREAIRLGIGPGKAYGFGLLSVAGAPE